MESSVVALFLEAGRLWGHLQKGSLEVGFMRRVEWFCGEVPGARECERWRAMAKVVLHMVWIMVGSTPSPLWMRNGAGGARGVLLLLIPRSHSNKEYYGGCSVSFMLVSCYSIRPS